MTTYSNDPAETARHWLSTGSSWLHVVNLDGAFGERDDANHSALQRILDIAKEFNAHIQFGGGLRSLQMIENTIELGVSRVVLGTIAIEQPCTAAKALDAFGAERIAVGIDARDGLVRLHGWNDNSGVSAAEFAISMKRIGLRTVIFTDVARDGLHSGLNIQSTRELAEKSGLDVIASGGAHSLKDVRAARNANLAGVIVGSALYEGTIDLRELFLGATNAR
jgi:phosphoribosylformimino-5-aminoimidazole carboxamide ribotide isomerase